MQGNSSSYHLKWVALAATMAARDTIVVAPLGSQREAQRRLTQSHSPWALFSSPEMWDAAGALIHLSPCLAYLNTKASNPHDNILVSILNFNFLLFELKKDSSLSSFQRKT